MEGQFRTYLGRLLMKVGDVDDARSCLASGQTLLEQVGDQFGLALLLCARAELEKSDVERRRGEGMHWPGQGPR